MRPGERVRPGAWAPGSGAALPKPAVEEGDEARMGKRRQEDGS